MPRLDTQHAVTIRPNATVEQVVATPRIPGLELHIPANTAIRDHQGKLVTEISITPIPVAKPPFPLPKDVYVPIYYTIQPGGAYIYSSGPEKGARIFYPNYRSAPAGTHFNFWYYDPTGEGWSPYGRGKVEPDGKQVVPNPGVVIYEFTGAMITSGDPSPEDPPPWKTPDGEPVDLFSGLFIVEKTDLVLPGVMPLALTRTFVTKDTFQRPFGIGATHNYELFLWTPTSDYSQAT